MRIALLSLLVLSVTPCAEGQDLTSDVRRHSVTDMSDAAHGLPSDLTTSVAQTSDGLVWIGSQSGMAVWDGGRIVNMTEDLLSLAHTARIVGLLASGDSLLVYLSSGEKLALRMDRHSGARWLQPDL